MTMIDYLTGTIPVTVTETERVLVLRHGRFASILTAGHYRLRKAGTTLHRHDIEANPAFVSTFTDALKRARPELHDAHLTEVRAEAAKAMGMCFGPSLSSQTVWRSGPSVAGSLAMTSLTTSHPVSRPL